LGIQPKKKFTELKKSNKKIEEKKMKKMMKNAKIPTNFLDDYNNKISL